jgi:hypothetical protein
MRCTSTTRGHGDVRCVFVCMLVYGVMSWWTLLKALDCTFKE